MFDPVLTAVIERYALKNAASGCLMGAGLIR